HNQRRRQQQRRWRRWRRRLFIVPAMVASSSCATDPQAHLPMLYYACPTATECDVTGKCDTQVILASEIHRNFQPIDSTFGPIGFNGASGISEAYL
ncbi:hypothetical protein ALC62_03178, partial [Cyphomyrmex costatus]